MDIQPLSSTFVALAAQRPPNASADARAAAAQRAIAQPQDPRSATDGDTTATPAGEQLNAAVEATRAFVQSFNSSLEFSIDKDTGTTVVKIVDKDTQELIRQIPSEEMIAIAKALDTIKGLLIEQKA